MKSILDMIGNAVKLIAEVLAKFLGKMIEKFLELNIFEKIVIVNIIGAFFAIVLPVAKYFIFETYFYINNHLAHYLIGIVIAMVITQRYHNKITFIVREVLNGYYLFWIIFLHLAGDLSKAPYKLTFGYYLNILIPIIFMGASFLSYRFFDDV